MMSSNPWPRFVARTLTLFTLIALAGLILGVLPETLLAALTCFLGYHGVSFYRLERWLRVSRKSRPPKLFGVWRAVADSIVRRHGRYRQRQQHLVALMDRLSDSVKAMPDGTIILSESGEMLWWNELAARYLGLQWPRDRFLRIGNLIRHPDFAEHIIAGELDAAVRIPAPRNSRRTLEMRLGAYGEAQHLLLVRDLTQIHRLETMRRDFVANITHELRTPLTVLRGMSEEIASMEAPDTESLVRPAQLMEQQIDRMSRLIEDLLLLSRLETEASTRASTVVDIPVVLDDVLKEAESLSGGRHRIQSQIDRELMIRGDEDELRSAFSNLLANAVSYTGENGIVDVQWFQAGGKACLAVADTGPGIAPHHIPRLTERFYRADSGRSAKSGGTGLGLAIVKHVLSRHAARLEINSTVGEGSTFTAVFPHGHGYGLQ